MNDYIDRSIIIEAVKGCRLKTTFGEHSETYNKTLDSVIKAVESVPVADVVEVVRCKACKYFKPDDDYEYGICMQFQDYTPDDDDFCSLGKKEVDNG